MNLVHFAAMELRVCKDGKTPHTTAWEQRAEEGEAGGA